MFEKGLQNRRQFWTLERQHAAIACNSSFVGSMAKRNLDAHIIFDHGFGHMLIKVSPRFTQFTQEYQVLMDRFERRSHKPKLIPMDKPKLGRGSTRLRKQCRAVRGRLRQSACYLPCGNYQVVRCDALTNGMCSSILPIEV
jgi:hypothetical protein